ncbi:hypothetical protein Cni_G17191 [Canna indica]|uniref:VOC domain-containing protein n=1 Tax=Canna indica TaxID=4628 RepID=A0AAQ3KK85_9LILI|nr:hypothetical protein Cni_G17191 [Canna indica]
MERERERESTGKEKDDHQQAWQLIINQHLKPVFAYTVVYVKDVAQSVAFYSNAFGFNVRRLDHSNRWGELDSGPTTIAFTPLHQRETDERSGAVRTPAEEEAERGPVDVCFGYADVDAAYRRAVENGAVPVSPPREKSWGQKVGYVRDIDGIIVRMESFLGGGSSTAASTSPAI